MKTSTASMRYYFEAVEVSSGCLAVGFGIASPDQTVTVLSPGSAITSRRADWSALATGS